MCSPRHRGHAWAEGRTEAVMTIERGVKRILIVMSVLGVLLVPVLVWPTNPYGLLFLLLLLPAEVLPETYGINLLALWGVLSGAGLALLWGTFYTLRWIARGFTGR
jgi:hypothetical protein